MSDMVQQVSSSTTVITFTDAATKHVVSYLSKQNDCKGIRLSVKKTGCSGLSYVVDYVNAPLPDDMVLPLASEYHVYIDKISFPYLKGMQVDYVKQGLNSKFIFNNPNQTGQCGCGESFTV
jgi:iron-sulfur cluster assembly protein